MVYYRHYSFDLWLTLIRSNPAFKQQRTQYFHQHYNYTHKSIDEIALAFRQIDVMCNTINEVTGKNIDADEMYLMALSTINNYKLPLHDIDILQLCREMDTLLMNYMPVVYCSQTHRVLNNLKQRGHTISLLSNTGFIKGAVLREVLQYLELDSYLDFQLYSDETGLSKPNSAFFKQMIDKASLLNNNILHQQIIHVGDNIKADVEGAYNAGLHTKLINSNNQCITCLLN